MGIQMNTSEREILGKYRRISCQDIVNVVVCGRDYFAIKNRYI